MSEFLGANIEQSCIASLCEFKFWYLFSWYHGSGKQSARL